MQTINLDISRKHGIAPIYAKQSEVGRKFVAVITDNGIPYNIPDNALLSVWYEGDTDSGNYSSIEERSAFSIDGNKVTVELVAQMLLQPGSGELCLSITHADNAETNTWNIPYCVEYKPGARSFVPTEYYTAFQEMASLVAKYSAEAKRAADSLNIFVPIGYTFEWSPVDGGPDLSTAEKVAEHYGFGTWEAYGAGRFALGVSDQYAVGTVGGEAEHKLNEYEMPTHIHRKIEGRSEGGMLTGQPFCGVSQTIPIVDRPNRATIHINKGPQTDDGEDYTFETSPTGGSQPHNNMPPYVVVYRWRRIA